MISTLEIVSTGGRSTRVLHDARHDEVRLEDVDNNPEDDDEQHGKPVTRTRPRTAREAV